MPMPLEGIRWVPLAALSASARRWARAGKLSVAHTIEFNVQSQNRHSTTLCTDQRSVPPQPKLSKTGGTTNLAVP